MSNILKEAVIVADEWPKTLLFAHDFAFTRLPYEDIKHLMTLMIPACVHEYVNVGFNSLKMVCKHCDKGAKDE